MALQSCLLGQAGGQRDVLPRTWGAMARNTEMQGPGTSCLSGFSVSFSHKGFQDFSTKDGNSGAQKTRK